VARAGRVIFLLLVDTGIRRGEVLGLRGRTVALADPAGPRIRIEETFTRQRVETPKSESSERTIEVSQPVADELFEHRARTAFGRDDEHVFCSPTKGTPFDVSRYTATFRLALAKAGIGVSVLSTGCGTRRSRTGLRRACRPPRSRSGPGTRRSRRRRRTSTSRGSSPEENAKLAERLWGASGTKRRYEIASEPVEEPAAQAEIRVNGAA
jgi:integrase